MVSKSKENVKSVITPESVYCRKCMKQLPASKFYDAVDMGKIDSNGKFSVCKDCVQTIYDELYTEYNSMEKAIHKMCIMLNLKYSNDAMSATKTHVQTLLEKGNNVKAIFSIYKMKVVATNKSMEKNIAQDDGYEDIGTIFIDKPIEPTKLHLPPDTIVFWGNDLEPEDILFLENEYINFKNTHSAETYAEVILLKQVCYTLLRIRDLRRNNEETSEAVKELQTLMKNMAISPNALSSASGSKGADTFGMWIADIEQDEPAQWLKTDPRGDMYRDVSDVAGYFEKYFVRPLKNFITQSKDFNVDDNDGMMDDTEFGMIDDGEL